MGYNYKFSTKIIYLSIYRCKKHKNVAFLMKIFFERKIWKKRDEELF